MALLAIAATASVAVACGDSDDASVAGGDRVADSSTSSKRDGSALDHSATLRGSDKAQIRRTLKYVRAAYAAADAEAYCAKFTGRARGEMLEYSFRPEKTCVALVRAQTELAEKLDTQHKPARTVSVDVNGDRAVAMISDGRRRPHPLRMVNDDGEWKLHDSGRRFRVITDRGREAWE